jgi:hypothetical protein
MLGTDLIVPKDQNNTDRTESKVDSVALVSWLFLLGSLLFVLDSGLEIIEGISLHSIIHLSASLLFTIGSILFLPQIQQQ